MRNFSLQELADAGKLRGHAPNIKPATTRDTGVIEAHSVASPLKRLHKPPKKRPQSELNTDGNIRKAPATRAKNFKGAWTIERKDSLGMTWEDAEHQFIRSRNLGIYGARQPGKPRT